MRVVRCGCGPGAFRHTRAHEVNTLFVRLPRGSFAEDEKAAAARETDGGRSAVVRAVRGDVGLDAPLSALSEQCRADLCDSWVIIWWVCDDTAVRCFIGGG